MRIILSGLALWLSAITPMVSAWATDTKEVSDEVAVEEEDIHFLRKYSGRIKQLENYSVQVVEANGTIRKPAAVSHTKAAQQVRVNVVRTRKKS